MFHSHHSIENHSDKHSMPKTSNYIGEYKITSKILGRGAFSTIYMGFHCNLKKKVAIKKLQVSSVNSMKSYVNTEISLHQKLSHSNIVSMYNCICDNQMNVIYLVLEYCNGGDFLTYQNKRPMTEWYIQKYMKQFSRGLEYLYMNGIFHRDLKTQNLLLDADKNLKISDFGLSKFEVDRQCNNSLGMEAKPIMHQTYCGSPLYMAPEILFHNEYNNKSDLWSVGVILYEMITGTQPFNVRKLYDLLENMKTTQFVRLPENINISPLLHNLLKDLLQKEPERRIEWTTLFYDRWICSDLILDMENKIIGFDIFQSLPKVDLVKPFHFEFMDDYNSYLDMKRNNQLIPKIPKPRLNISKEAGVGNVKDECFTDCNLLLSVEDNIVNNSYSSNEEEEEEYEDGKTNLELNLEDAILTPDSNYILPDPIFINNNNKTKTKTQNYNQNARDLGLTLSLSSPNYKNKTLKDIRNIRNIKNSSTPSSISPASITNSLKNIISSLNIF